MEANTAVLTSPRGGSITFRGEIRHSAEENQFIGRVQVPSSTLSGFTPPQGGYTRSCKTVPEPSGTPCGCLYQYKGSAVDEVVAQTSRALGRIVAEQTSLFTEFDEMCRELERAHVIAQEATSRITWRGEPRVSLEPKGKRKLVHCTA